MSDTDDDDPIVEAFMYAGWDGRGEENLVMEPKRVLEIKILGEPRAQEDHLARLMESGRCVSYDPCLAAKRDLKELVRVTLQDVGPTPGFPIFKGRRALLMPVTYNATGMSKNATNLQAFVEDVLEGLAYEKRNLLHVVHVMKKPPGDEDTATFVRVAHLFPDRT
jgi:hypothetical protein